MYYHLLNKPASISQEVLTIIHRYRLEYNALACEVDWMVMFLFEICSVSSCHRMTWRNLKMVKKLSTCTDLLITSLDIPLCSISRLPQ